MLTKCNHSPQKKHVIFSEHNEVTHGLKICVGAKKDMIITRSDQPLKAKGNNFIDDKRILIFGKSC